MGLGEAEAEGRREREEPKKRGKREEVVVGGADADWILVVIREDGGEGGLGVDGTARGFPGFETCQGRCQRTQNKRGMM